MYHLQLYEMIVETVMIKQFQQNPPTKKPPNNHYLPQLIEEIKDHNI